MSVSERLPARPRLLRIGISLGHYTSTVYDAKGDAWWTYDDTSVSSCTEHRVLKDLAPDAYGVMYMHKSVVASA